MFISIGKACNVRHQIEKYRGIERTLFFDWLMTDMTSVNLILDNYKNIDNILNFDVIKRCEKYPFHNQNSRILISSVPYCVSIHDINKDYTDKDILDFIEKYKRRYARIIEYISSDKKLYFIRFGSISNDEQNTFIKTIEKINPNCDFVLINIIIDQDQDSSIFKNKFLEIKIKKSEISYPEDWKTSYLNWEQIFKDIEKYTQ